MKKIFCIALLVVVGFLLFASGGSEKPIELVVLGTGDTVYGDTSRYKIAEEKFKADYPDIKIKYLKIDLSDGSTVTMDAMIGAGNAPNIYEDSMVRASKYMIPEYALPLQNKIRDLDKYSVSELSLYTRDGNLMALPLPGSGQAMCINLEIMKEIGYEVKPGWTIDDFLEMAELVKKKYEGKKWATGMFAANQSGDYLINGWYASFGVQFYQNANYDEPTLKKTGAENVYKFYQTLVKNGYIPPNAELLADDDYVIQWAKGDFAATAFFPTWCKMYSDTVINQGLRDKPFPYTFVPFPKAKGVDKVPTYYNNHVYIVKNTGTAIDDISARFVEYLNCSEVQGKTAIFFDSIPNRNDATGKPKDPGVFQLIDIIKNNGLQDVGLTDPRFTERRATQYPILQKVLNLQITPEEGIAQYEAKLKAVKK